MTNEDEHLHRTLVQLLIDNNSPELAAVMIDGGFEVLRHEDDGTPYVLAIDVPTMAYEMIAGNVALKQTLVRAAKTVITGHIWIEERSISLRIKLIQPEENWQSITRDLIVNYKGSNQGAITKKVFLRERKPTLIYNEASYGSHSEIRIAQELENRQVLFFPLALGIRAETGEFYRDHREADFLVCADGTWGVLEVSYHPDRFEKDKEKDAWWKQSGILCVEHYTAERCYREPSQVVDEFLTFLQKHKR